jgi:hypothetical protein
LRRSYERVFDDQMIRGKTVEGRIAADPLKTDAGNRLYVATAET